MWPDRVSNPGPLTNESGALPTALCSRAFSLRADPICEQGGKLKLRVAAPERVCLHIRYLYILSSLCSNEANFPGDDINKP